MWKQMRRKKKNESEIRSLDEHKLFKHKKIRSESRQIIPKKS